MAAFLGTLHISIDWFLHRLSRPPFFGSYATCTYNYRCSLPRFQNIKLPPSPSAPVSYLLSHIHVGRSVSMYLSGLSWPSSTSFYQHHLSSLCVLEYRGRHCSRLSQHSNPQGHLSCLYCHWRATENALDVNLWSLTCPHSMPFLHLIPAFEQDVSYRLSSLATLTWSVSALLITWR
jgi:hypothetical protein